MAVVDLNGDGKPDLALADTYMATVGVLLGLGDGAFAPRVDYPVGTSALAVAAADMNGDGKPDLAVVSPMDGAVSVLLNNGDGTFAPKVAYPTGTNIYSVTAADLNGDGKADLAVVSQFFHTVSVLLTEGDGTFAANVDYPTGNVPTSVAAADLNGDGKPDLVVSNLGDSTVSVFSNNGDGTFAAKVDVPAGPPPAFDGMGPQAVVAVDLNGDGKPDLAVASSSSSAVNVLLNNGDGTFAPEVDYLTDVGSTPLSIFAADLNGDGKPDLVITNGSFGGMEAGTVSVFLNNGDGTFASRIEYPTGASPVSVVAADLNGDGTIDLAVANDQSSTVSVLLNQCLP